MNFENFHNRSRSHIAAIFLIGGIAISWTACSPRIGVENSSKEAATTPSPAPDVGANLSLFGVPFDKKLPSYIKMCASLGGGLYSSFPETSPCYEPVSNQDKITNENFVVNINYPIDKRPSIARGNHINVEYVEGRAQYFFIETGGKDFEDRDLSALIEKFGPPSDRQELSKQNSFGASFTGIKAKWDLPKDVHVLYESISDELNSGYVVVFTTGGKKFVDDKYVRERNASQTSM